MSIVYSSNGTPQWDVSTVTAYPVEILQKNKPIVVYAHMTPYTSDELKAALRRGAAGYRRDKRDVEIEREDRSIYTPLCDNCFVKLDNATGTPEQQRAWLDKNPELKPSLVEYTFGALRKAEADTADESDILDITLELNEAVKAFQDLYDDVNRAVVRVDVTFNHKQPAEAQYRDYRGARRQRYAQRRNLWTINENYDVLERLFDNTVTSVAGILVNGKNCDAINKADWIKSIPLWHKLWVVDQIFAELVEKNA